MLERWTTVFGNRWADGESSPRSDTWNHQLRCDDTRKHPMTTTKLNPNMAAVAPNTRPTILPARGVARVKSVLSGDTVILLGKATTPNGKVPEVMFTMEAVTAPR